MKRSIAACFVLNSNIMIRCFLCLHLHMDRAIAACFSSNDFKDASSEGLSHLLRGSIHKSLQKPCAVC
jgi:hypothetical protein